MFQSLNDCQQFSLIDVDTGLCLPGFSGTKGSVSGGEPAPISAGCLGAERVDGRSY